MNSTNGNRTWFILSEHEQIVYRSVAFTLIALGIIVNAFLLYFYYVKLISRTQFNFFLFHLGIANIVLYIGFIPYITLDVREFSKISDIRAVYVLCSLKDGLTMFFFPANFTVYTLCLMTYIRYRLICYPLKAHQITKINSSRWIVLFWIVALISMSPNFFTLYAEGDKPFCLRTYPFGKMFFQLFGLLTISVGFVIPVAIFTTTYLLVVAQLYFREQPSKIMKNSKSRLKYRKKVVQALGFVVFGFVFCWFPFMCAWMVSIFGYFNKSMEDEIKKARMYRFVSLPSLFTGFLNVLCNVASSSRLRKNISKRMSRKITATTRDVSTLHQPTTSSRL